MCRNGLFTEHGIKARDGFGSEYYRLVPEFVVPVDESLGLFAVLVEPASVVAKAWQHIERIGVRSTWKPKRVLVTGAGPIGLLTAMFGVQRGLDVHVYDHNDRGPKPRLVRSLGATYHSGALSDLPDFDIVLDSTGDGTVAFETLDRAGPNGIVCLLSVSSTGECDELDVGSINRDLVLGNRVIVGSVNANRSHYDDAIAALLKADREWLQSLITRRVPLAEWSSALDHDHDDVKTVILFSSEYAL
jgi:threonine dehydrogenase-like Zn-dependent dehydrogenase